MERNSPSGTQDRFSQPAKSDQQNKESNRQLDISERYPIKYWSQYQDYA
jgi:hypothetical protein